jgi:hypothetical protein
MSGAGYASGRQALSNPPRLNVPQPLARGAFLIVAFLGKLFVPS